MATTTALNVVKQIQALADGPKSVDMGVALGNVAPSLLVFLEHPDNRVRLIAARTLLRLKTGYPEQLERVDLGRVRNLLERLEEDVATGCPDAESEELRRLLCEVLGKAFPQRIPHTQASAPASAWAGSAASAPPSGTPGYADGRGQVVLKVAAHSNAIVKHAILEKVVTLPGVVSLTFEGPYIVVSTRSPALAADAAFRADLVAEVQAQASGLGGVSVVSGYSDLPQHAGGGAEKEFRVAGSGGEENRSGDLDAEGVVEPSYLDEQEDYMGGGAGGTGGSVPGVTLGSSLPGNQWSFFSQTNWMTGRRIQEFGDDPSIAARLAKAKQREEEKRQEERSRLGLLSSWLSGSR